MTGSFFSRWSQRKQAAVKGLPAEELASGADQESTQDAVRAEQAVNTPAVKPAEPLPTLEDVKDLTPSSDFRSFMRQGVASDVRNAAVKKLFADPHFNVMDGLDIYIGDYNTPDPLPAGMLQNMVGAKMLDLFPQSDHAAQCPSPVQDRTALTEENPNQSPDAPEGSPFVAQSPQVSEPTEHDHPDLQLQPNHAPASPSSGASTG